MRTRKKNKPIIPRTGMGKVLTSLGGLYLFLLLNIYSVAQAQSLKLGAILDLSATSSVVGQSFLRGLELAVEEDASQVEIFAEDSQGNSKKAVPAANDLIALHQVSAIFLMSFDELQVVYPLAQRAKSLTINLADSSPKIEQFGDLSFGFGEWEPAAAERAAVFAYEDLRARTAAIVCQHDDWSERVCREFRKRYQELGGRIAIGQSLNPEQLDFRAVIARLRAAKPALVFFPLRKNGTEFLRQLKQQSLGAKLLTVDLLPPEERLAKDWERLYQIQTVVRQNDRLNKLLGRYQRRHGEECQRVKYLAWGYDSGRLVIEAWKRSGFKIGEALAVALREIKMYPGASGLVSVNNKGSSPKFPGAFEVVDGHLRELTIARY